MSHVTARGQICNYLVYIHRTTKGAEVMKLAKFWRVLRGVQKLTPINRQYSRLDAGSEQTGKSRLAYPLTFPAAWAG